jgi:hypothetical protein
VAQAPHTRIGREPLGRGGKVEALRPAAGDGADHALPEAGDIGRLGFDFTVRHADLHMEHRGDAERHRLAAIGGKVEGPLQVGLFGGPGIAEAFGLDEVKMRIDDPQLVPPSCLLHGPLPPGPSG